MGEKLRYLSTEWCDEVKARLANELSPEKMKFITTSMTNVYKNCPDGKEKYLYFRCEDGVFTEVSVGEGEPPKAEFVITGDYNTFANISQGKLKSQRALMGGKLKLRGNMVKALKLASLADRLNSVIANIPTDY
ncbi:MAG: SCP2 sterol-binding domain-containing protein [Deltaproteobacteria bacterium]|nr:SCP2 sterol-binding domain-containing protein [Deltaproteobacteria bacterium]